MEPVPNRSSYGSGRNWPVPKLNVRCNPWMRTVEIGFRYCSAIIPVRRRTSQRWVPGIGGSRRHPRRGCCCCSHGSRFRRGGGGGLSDLACRRRCWARRRETAILFLVQLFDVAVKTKRGKFSKWAAAAAQINLWPSFMNWGVTGQPILSLLYI